MRQLLPLIISLLAITSYAQTHSWSLPFDSDGDDEVCAVRYANGQVYVAGEYAGVLDVDPSSFSVNLNVGTAVNGFIAIYTDAGVLVNGFRFANGDGYRVVNGVSKHFDEGEVSVKDMAVDNAGNIYVVGSFIGIIDFNPQGEVYAVEAPEGEYSSTSNDGFIAKYSPSGVLLWMRRVGGGEGDDITQVELDDAGNVYYQGTFSESVDFDENGDGDVKSGADSNYGNNTFITKVSANNEYFYTLTIQSFNGGDAGRIFTSDFKVDKTHNAMYIAGHFAYKVYFDNNSDTYSLANDRSGKYSGYIAKYDLDGNFVWASEAIQGEATTIAKIVSIAITPDGDVFSVGDFGQQGGSITFNGGGVISSELLSYSAHFGLFSATTGESIWGWGITDGEEYSKIYPMHAMVSPDNEFYVLGRYIQSMNFKVDNVDATLSVTESSDGGNRKYDNFMFKIDSKSVMSYRSFGGSGNDGPEGGLALGDNKEIYTGGIFAGQADASIEEEGATVFDFSSDGGFISRFDNAQERSNAKNIVASTVGTIDNLNNSISVPVETSVNELARAISVSPMATFTLYDGTTPIDTSDVQIVQPTLTIVVKAENESEKIYEINLQTSELFSTAIGVLDNDNKMISRIPENTMVGDFLDGLVYSAGGVAYISTVAMNPEALTDSSILSSAMSLYIANSDTTVYTLSLLRTGNTLFSTQVGRIVGDTIYCASGVDLYGFSKGLVVSEGASMSFYEEGVPIVTLANAYISSQTSMHITSESGAVHVLEFIIVDNAENFILSTANGILITITSEILNVSSQLTVDEFLQGLTLSTGAVANVVQMVGESSVIVDLDEMISDDFLVQVESIAGDVRSYSFIDLVNGISSLESTALRVAYSSNSSELLLFTNTSLYAQSLVVYDINGNLCYRTDIMDVTKRLSFNVNLKSGLYLVLIKGDNKQNMVKRVIVN